MFFFFPQLAHVHGSVKCLSLLGSLAFFLFEKLPVSGYLDESHMERKRLRKWYEIICNSRCVKQLAVGTPE